MSDLPPVEATKEALKKGEYINSYYLGFEATGVPAIDAILVAVARAGKAYHSTEFWIDEGLDGGPSYNDLIQKAADDAAGRLVEAPTVDIDSAVEALNDFAYEVRKTDGNVLLSHWVRLVLAAAGVILEDTVPGDGSTP